MADNSLLYYLSSWDIDQLYATDTVTIAGAGTTTVYTIPSDLPALPTFNVQFQPTGSSQWFDPGVFATAGTFATVSSFYTSIVGGAIVITTFSAGTARYFVWTDKLDY